MTEKQKITELQKNVGILGIFDKDEMFTEVWSPYFLQFQNNYAVKMGK